MPRFWVRGLVLCSVLIVGSAYGEHKSYMAGVDTSVGMVDPRGVTLRPTPIRQDWILEGQPDAASAEIAHSNDGSTQVFVWRTTAGRFNWFYESDEVVSVLDGEMYLIDGANGDRHLPERRLGPGDVAFFPAGSAATWRVPDHVRKIATLRHPLPGPVASLVRWVKAVKSWAVPTSALASP